MTTVQWRPSYRIIDSRYPFVGLFFSVIPALESQTRLMFGFYLEYRVTEKE